MKVWLINIVWLIIFFFFKPSNSEALSSSSSSSSSLVKPSTSHLSSSTTTLPSNRHETALVATLDGTLSLIEIDSLKIVWSIKTGLPIYSSYQASQNLDLNAENASGHGDDTYIDCGDDWILYMHDRDKGIMERLKSAKDLIRETKGLSKNGTTVIGQMATTVFFVDAKTGTVIRTVKFSDSSGLGFEDGENPIISKGSEEQISITRTDYSFLAYSKSTGKVLWNVTLAEFEAESFCPKVERSIIDNLQDQLGSVYKDRSEKCELCVRRPIVYRIRDRGYSELVSGVGLITDMSGSFPGDKRLPLLGPPHLQFPLAVGEIPGIHFDIDQLLALPYPENPDSFSKSAALALPSSVHHSGSTTYPDSSIGQIFWSPILSGLLVLISVGYAVYRNVFGKVHRQHENLATKYTTPKKKKSRKSGISKNNTVVNDKKEGIAKADDGRTGFPHAGMLDGKFEPFTSIVDIKFDGRRIGKLCVSNYEIAKGSNGTVVLEGTYDGRPVAVKRLVRTHHDVALKEIQNLIASDQHSNIVRFYGVEFDSDFVYLSLERCLCSLTDLIYIFSESSQDATLPRRGDSGSMSGYTAQMLENIQTNKDFDLWKANGFPSPQLLKVMRDVVSGVAHLHELCFIHRDLKPQNVLINKERVFCAKLSDMGISKRLAGDMSSLTQHATGAGSSGWRAPEQILHGRQTRAVDLFSLGCVLFFCMTGGKHPFGDVFERDANIVKNRKDLFLVEHVPEAVDLITYLLDPNPELRPKAAEVLHHPLFWNSEKRLSFLRDASDRVELEDREINSELLKALEATGAVALGGKWDDKLDSSFLTNISRYRRYKYDSVRDLLRVIRNKLNHYRELPTEIQEVLGSVPEGFNIYFTTRFPKLLIEVYRVIYEYCREEELLGKYFRSSLL